MPIHRLLPLVVNQIAAGEVVERPASVVKELIENAIDAAATFIDVAVDNGGRDLIQVTDNGAGIPLDELALAIAPHATSKIDTTDDLKSIATLGFRGEALASIASVSRMSLVSRPRDAQEAGRIEAQGDHIGSPRPAPGPPGTCVVVRNLFFNTPARRRFLRTEPTEAARITQTVQSLALGHPRISFTLHVNGNQTIEVTACHTANQRVFDILGPHLQEHLLEVHADDRGISIRGVVGKPDIARGTARHQQVFLNGRAISDRSINHAIKEAYRGLIDPTRYPTIVLFLEMDPGQVDVNVHPAKAQVRFRNQGIVHGAVLSAVRECLRKADLTPAFDLQPIGVSSASTVPMPAFGSGAAGQSVFARGASTAEFVEYFRRLDPTQKGFVYSEVKQALAADAPHLLGGNEGDAASDSAAAIREVEVLPMIRPVTDVLQVHSSYIVTQDEQGLLIIDQHALHERVMFERLKQAVGKGNLESQRLLMPTTIEVDPAQIELLQQLRPLLERIGIEAEAIGPSAIAVHGFSSFLFERRVEPAEFIIDLLDQAANEGVNQDAEAALHETLDMMACKAAIKAGDRLSQEELADLLRCRETVERASSCPHGRPTTLRLTIADLDKQFGRR
ncbi:MAG: DNA mismatch repair endonuclease MutL [Planctomycetota bacterium]|nr:DNA mismatch repair endonuclease MutL [Planctomycetota bacterium]